MGHYAHIQWAAMLIFESVQDLVPFGMYVKTEIRQKYIF